MKKIDKIILTLGILIMSYTFNIEAKPINENFDDDNFYRCIIDNLNEENINGINNRDETYNIPDEELTVLPTLTCISYGITSIKGIEKLSGITYLDLENNQLQVVDLSYNNNITYLFVDKNVEVKGYNGLVENEVGQLDETNTLSTNFNITVPVIIIGIISLLVIIELYILFQRLNEKGWKAIIPIYNSIVLLNLTNQPIWYFVLLLIPIVNIFVMYKVGIFLTEQFNKDKKMAILFAILPFIGLIILLFKNDSRLDNIQNSSIQDQEEAIPNVIVQSEPLGFIDEDYTVSNVTEEQFNPQIAMMNQLNNMNENKNSLNDNQTNNTIYDNSQLKNNESSQVSSNTVINDSSNIKKNSQKNDMEYKVCFKCGNKLRSDATMCFICGNKLD